MTKARKQNVARTILGMMAVIAITSTLVVVAHVLYVSPRAGLAIIGIVAFILLYIWAVINA